MTPWRWLMLSKDWKFLVVSLTAVSMLAACQKKHNDDGDASVSIFTGVWMSEKPITTYRQNATAISNRDADGFCQEVAEDPVTFGITQQSPWKDVVVDALLIQVDGNVSRYDPEIRSRSANPAYVEALHIGHVSNDGEFKRTVPPSARVNRTGYGYAGLSNNTDPRFSMSDTTFFRDNDNQITVDRLAGRYYSGREVYLRIEEQEIKGYFHAVRTCIDLFRSGNFDPRWMHQGPPGPQVQLRPGPGGPGGPQAGGPPPGQYAPGGDPGVDRRLRVGPPPTSLQHQQGGPGYSGNQ